ncbi:MAG: hypothetical protein H6613_20765 [Ignavibacteriales bacterium]|nr:hypothetical protein [Ignavibacteriota bacterium]MCB9250798.1 hypothetical protein [Ignavibacteriales bacterium]
MPSEDKYEEQKEIFKYDLLKTYNEQFAQNQNHHQILFIQVVSILLTVIIGFGYSLYNFKTSASNYNIDSVGIFEFSAALLISEGIITLGIAIVCNMALGYRREQLINSFIREVPDLFFKTIKERETRKHKIFPISYNPVLSYYEKMNSKFIKIYWMPNFHSIFFIGFIILQILLIVIYSLKLSLLGYLDGNNMLYEILIIFIISVISPLFSYFVLSFFHSKIEKFYFNNGLLEKINNRYRDG